MNKISNPFSQMLVSLTPDGFFGRRAEIETTLQGISSREPRSFVIHGAKTIGKTSLLKNLCHPRGAIVKYAPFLTEYGPGRAGKLAFQYIDFYRKVDALPTLYKQLLGSEEIRQITGLSLDAESEPETDIEIKKAFKDILSTLQNAKVRLVICLDHFDKAFQSMEYEDDVFLRGLTNYQSFIIITEKSLPELRRDLRRTSPLVNVLIPRNIELLTIDEAKELIETPAKNAGTPFRPSEIEFILDTAGRQPYLLTLVCEFLFQLRIQYPEIIKSLSKDEKMQQRVILQLEAVPAVMELFDLFWNQLGEEEQQTLFKLALGEPANLEVQQTALRRLNQRALIYESLQDRKSFVFSRLFQRYVRRQRPLRTQDDIEKITNSLGPLDKKLFEYLLEHPNQLCTFEELLGKVWGDPNASKRGLEAAIGRLRTRLDDVGGTGRERIQNVRGKGYQYIPQST